MIEIQLIEENEKSMTIALSSTDTTLINPIMDIMDRDENVKIVRYINIHPELEKPRVYVEVKNGSPRDAIIKAANELSGYFSSINQVQTEESRITTSDKAKVSVSENKTFVANEEKKEKEPFVAGGE